MNLFEGIPTEKILDEKKRAHLFDVADMVVSLSEIARREGLLGLDERADFSSHKIMFDKECGDFLPALREIELTDEEHLVFSTLIHLVVDGCAREKIRDIAKYAVSSSVSSEERKLSLKIGAEGILAVCEGFSSETIMIESAMMMGANAEDYLSHKKRIDDEKIASDNEIRAFFAEEKEEDGQVEEAEDDSEIDFDFLLFFDEDEILKIMRASSFDDVVLALKNVSGEVRTKVMGSLPKKIAAKIREACEFTGPVRLKDIEKSQAAIIRTAKKMHGTKK